MVWYKVIIVSALSLSLRDKDRLRDRESLTKMIIDTIINDTSKYISFSSNFFGHYWVLRQKVLEVYLPRSPTTCNMILSLTTLHLTWDIMLDMSNKTFNFKCWIEDKWPITGKDENFDISDTCSPTSRDKTSQLSWLWKNKN